MHLLMFLEKWLFLIDLTAVICYYLKMLEKVVRDGKVAVIFSPGYGAGWYSWHLREDLLFEPAIVHWIEQGDFEKIQAHLHLKYPDVYFGDIEDLSIKWLDQGTEFIIDEYDGHESVCVKNEVEWLSA